MYRCGAQDLRPLALWDYWKFKLLAECFETFGPSLCDCWNLKVYFKDSVLWTFSSSFVRLLIFYIEAVLRTFSPSLMRLLIVKVIFYTDVDAVLGTFGPSPCETIGNLNYIFLLILVVCIETFGPSLCDCWKLKVYFEDSVLWTFDPSFVRLLIFYIEAVLGTFGPSLVRLLIIRIIL